MTPLAWLFLLAGLVSLDVRMIPAILPAVAGSLGVSAGEAGLGMTAYALSYGLMQVVYGPLSDRIGRIRLIRVTALLFAAGTALTALATTSGAWVAARLVTGIFAAATIPTSFTYIGDTVHYAERQRVVTYFAMAFSSAQALSATLAGTVTHYVSWRVLFAAYAVLTLATLTAMGGAREAPRATAGERLHYVDLLRMGRAARVYLATFTEGFLLWGGTTYVGVLASRRYGLNDLQVGLLVASYGVGTIVGALLLGGRAARLGERTMARLGGAAQLLGFGVLAAPVPWTVYAVGLVAIGVGLASLHATLQTRATELVPAARGKAFSLFALGFFVGGSIGTAALGILVDAGRLETVMAVCAVGLAAVGEFVAREKVSPRTGA